MNRLSSRSDDKMLAFCYHLHTDCEVCVDLYALNSPDYLVSRSYSWTSAHNWVLIR